MTAFWGFSMAANSMVSNLIGQNRKDEVMPLINRIIKMATGIALLVILINVLIPVRLMGLFTSDVSLIADSQGALMMFAWP
jgi:Na+-driven multidrug efflux pump